MFVNRSIWKVGAKKSFDLDFQGQTVKVRSVWSVESVWDPWSVENRSESVGQDRVCRSFGTAGRSVKVGTIESVGRSTGRVGRSRSTVKVTSIRSVTFGRSVGRPSRIVRIGRSSRSVFRIGRLVTVGRYERSVQKGRLTGRSVKIKSIKIEFFVIRSVVRIPSTGRKSVPVEKYFRKIRTGRSKIVRVGRSVGPPPPRWVVRSVGRNTLGRSVGRSVFRSISWSVKSVRSDRSIGRSVGNGRSVWRSVRRNGSVHSVDPTIGPPVNNLPIKRSY